MLTQIWRAADNFVILGNFLLFYPTIDPKIKIWKKMWKTPDNIILLHMCTINQDHMMYSSWDIEHHRQNCRVQINISWFRIYEPFFNFHDANFPTRQKITIPKYNAVSYSQRNFFSAAIKNKFQYARCRKIAYMHTLHTRNHKFYKLRTWLLSDKYVSEHNLSVSWVLKQS